jgi:uncharacterized membrane protein YqaE (UPF0057 family)
MKKLLLLAVLATFIFSSCNYFGNIQVEKRHYGKGYYVHRSGARNETLNPVNETVLASKNETPAVTNENVFSEEANKQTVSSSTILPAKKNTHNNPIRTKSNAVKKNSATSKIRDAISPAKNNTAEPAKEFPASGDVALAVMVLLAIFLSPIAVVLKEGATNRFWIDLICWLIGVGFIFISYFSGLLLLFAIIFALLIVLDKV